MDPTKSPAEIEKDIESIIDVLTAQHLRIITLLPHAQKHFTNTFSCGLAISLIAQAISSLEKFLRK